MKLLFILIFYISFISVNAQNLKRHSFRCNNRELSDVLLELENIHAVKFSYNATVMKDNFITLNMDYTSLKQVIDEISKQVNFVFNKIDERYYVVKKNYVINVCGYLKHGIDEIPIEGVTVVNIAGNKGTVSNKDGFFELKNIKKTDTLTLSFLGYKSILLAVKDIQNKKCDTYVLSPESHILDEVIVQEYLASGISKTRDGSIKINPNNLDILFGLVEPDVLQNIQLLPGIESPSETASELHIRGGTPDQNLVLWDGIKMYSTNHFFGMLSAFNPYVVKDIKVYRGGVKPQYGDRVSGVIDIRTDTLVPKKILGGLGLNMMYADGYLKIPLSNKVGVIVSARRSLTDVLQTPTFNSFSRKVFQNTSIEQDKNIIFDDISKNRETIYFTDFTLKAIANISTKDKISISSLFAKNKLHYAPEPINISSGITDTTGLNLSFSHALNIKNIGTSTTWEKTWSDKFSSRPQFYYSEYDLNYKGRNPFFPDAFVEKTNNVKEVGFSIHTNWVINDALTFSNGYQFFYNQVSYALKSTTFVESNGEDNQQTNALYSHISYNSSKDWHFDIGLRVNHYTTFNALYTEPRLYLEKIFGNNFRLKGSAEIINQTISKAIELTTLDFDVENQVWVLANEGKTPLLKSSLFSIGALFDKKGWNIDIDAYHKRTSGLTSLTRGFESITENFAKGESITNGVDILLKKKLNRYSTSLGYTYSTTNYIFENLNEGKPFRGNNDITHSLAWSHSYTNENFEFSLGWKYRTGTPFTKATGQTKDGNIEYEGINSATLPAYHRLDFSALYKFKNSNKSPLNGKIGFSLLNVYNQKNILKRSYSTFNFLDNLDSQKEKALEVTQVHKYSLGFTPNIIFRLNF